MMPRSNPFSFCGEAATALLGRAASAASDAGSPCVGRPESIPSKGAPAALRAVGELPSPRRGRNARPVCGIAPRIREWAQKIPAASGCGEDMQETEKPGRSAQIL